MKLLNAAVSPFAARVRLAIYHADLPVEIAPANMWAPGGGKTAEYLALNPLGKIPCLVLDDGSALPESETIVEYLADVFPDANLRPDGAEDIARARLLSRVMELYVINPSLAPLFGQLFSPARDQGVVDAALKEMDKSLTHIDRLIGSGAWAVGDRFSIADCGLIPYLWFFPGMFAQGMGDGALIGNHPRLSAYWDKVRSSPTVERVLNEMHTAAASTPFKALLKDTAEA